MHVDHDLADAEVMKELAISTSNQPAALDAAVAAELKNDPTIKRYEGELAGFHAYVTSLAAQEADGIPTPDPQRVLEAAFAQSALEEYKKKAEGAARERLAKIPNEALRAALKEHEIRHKYLTAKKAELSAELLEAEKRIEAIVDGESETHEAGCPAAALASPPTPYRIGQGDTLYLHVEGTLPDQPIEGLFTVWADGNLPLGSGYGFVPVLGLTAEEAQAAIAEKLGEVLSEPLVDHVIVVRKAQRAGDHEPPAASVSVKIIQRPLVYDSRVTAYLEVATSPDLSNLSRKRESASVLALLESEAVLTAAFDHVAPKYERLHKIAELEPRAGGTWLRKRLKVSFADKSPILELRMPADEDGASVALMTAIIDEFKARIAESATGGGGGAAGTVENPSPSPSLRGRGRVESYRIGPGDALLVRVLGALPEHPVDGPFVVEDEGTIALGPAYGRVEVAGLTVREAEAEVLESLTATLKDVVKHPPKVQMTIAEKALRSQAGGGEF